VARFSKQFGDGADGFGRVEIARVVVVDGAEAIHDAGVVGVGAGGFGSGLEGVAGALGGFPQADGAGVGAAIRIAGSGFRRARCRVQDGGRGLGGEQGGFQADGGERERGRGAAQRGNPRALAVDAREAHTTLRVSGRGADGGAGVRCGIRAGTPEDQP